MNWNLKLIQTFILVAQTKNFSKAAEQASRSQPAISSQINELENQLGFKLFERTSRSVRLTAEGAALLEGAEKAIAELAISYADARRVADSRQENVRIACLPTLSSGPLPQILNMAREQLPQVNVLISEMNNEDLLNAVREQKVDYGIGVKVPADDCLIQELGNDEMVAIVARDSPYFGHVSIDMADVLAFPILILPQATPTILAFEKVSIATGQQIEIVHRFAQPETLIAMAHQGVGVAILPWSYVSQKPDRNHALRLTTPSLQRQLAIIQSKARVPTPATTALLRLTTEVFSNLAQNTLD